MRKGACESTCVYIAIQNELGKPEAYVSPNYDSIIFDQRQNGPLDHRNKPEFGIYPYHKVITIIYLFTRVVSIKHVANMKLNHRFIVTVRPLTITLIFSDIDVDVWHLASSGTVENVQQLSAYNNWDNTDYEANTRMYATVKDSPTQYLALQKNGIVACYHDLEEGNNQLFVVEP